MPGYENANSTQGRAVRFMEERLFADGLEFE